MKFIITIIALLLSGCIHKPGEPYMKFDPNEIILNGKVILKKAPNKEHIKQRIQNQEENKNIELTLSAILSVGTGIFMMPYYNDDSVSGIPTQYNVKLKTGKTINIFNYYSGFSIGECVNVFISENWETYPPRMASGGQC